MKDGALMIIHIYAKVSNRKLNFLTQLKILIGEQKIDVLINDGSEAKQIFKTAKQTGIRIMNEYQENIEIILDECQKHQKRIDYSSQKMQSFMPLTLTTYSNLSEDEIGYIDQFLFRFIKLQDTIGAKLFPNILLFLAEDIANKSFIDRLHRLEQLELLDSKDAWNNLRSIRNNLTYEYERVSAASIVYLNEIYQKRDELMGFYLKIQQYYQSR
ncbi:hypothetical protein SPONN_389 [uncultured Candidatus Thioglobus sp.]|nr:hypothetical protein SPONN_389 [uncultured Candidatus Thioglobus sp.]